MPQPRADRGRSGERRQDEASVRLVDKFPVGTEVRLVQTEAHSTPGVPAGEEVGAETVGEDGGVSFDDVELGRAYLAVATIENADGSQREISVRVRAKNRRAGARDRPPRVTPGPEEGTEEETGQETAPPPEDVTAPPQASQLPAQSPQVEHRTGQQMTPPVRESQR